ncbi:hypothetical protein STEG23_018823, partial [Scotinomys teguina]
LEASDDYKPYFHLPSCLRDWRLAPSVARDGVCHILNDLKSRSSLIIYDTLRISGCFSQPQMQPPFCHRSSTAFKTALLAGDQALETKVCGETSTLEEECGYWYWEMQVLCKEISVTRNDLGITLKLFSYRLPTSFFLLLVKNINPKI